MNIKTDIELIPAYAHPQEIGSLFAEYTDMLIAGDASFREYLSLQHYDEECRHPEEKYGHPFGRLYLARCGGEAAGCIGLRRIDTAGCEMKRLYVRPRYRGMGLADRLVRQILSDAVEIGYSYMLLDTLPFLEGALYLYRKLGFYEISSYNDSPMDSSIYMRKDL